MNDMRHNCVVVADSLKCAYAHHRPDWQSFVVGRWASNGSSGASSPRLRPAQRNYRDPQAGGSTGVGQVWWVAGAGCICDAIAPGRSLYMRHNCVVVADSLKCAYANPRPDWQSFIVGWWASNGRADAMVGLVQNRKEGLLVLLVKQHKTVLLGHDLGEINQHIHRQRKNS